MKLNGLQNSCTSMYILWNQKAGRQHVRWMRVTKMNVEISVLNNGRVIRDIGQYLLFCLLPIRYGEIIRHIVCSKKRPRFEISADKSPDIGQ